MLSTAELIEATNALPWPRYVPSASKVKAEERLALIKERDEKVFALETEWNEWLSATYGGFLPQLPDEVNEALLQNAWDVGHSNGYEAVEQAYQEMAEQALKIAKAAKNFFRQR